MDWECDYAVNVTISNNWISNGGYSSGDGGIVLYVDSTLWDSNALVPQAGCFRPLSREYLINLAGGFLNISVINNTIINSSHDNIRIHSATNVVIANNTISGPLSFSYPVPIHFDIISFYIT